MNNKITFPRLATLLADRSGRSKRFSEDFLREFFSLISETLEAQESVKIKGLGTFRLTRVEPRRSVDVTTGEPMEIAGHTKVVFTPSKELADAVNSPFEAFTAIEISDDANIEQLFPEDDIDIYGQNDSESEESENENAEPSEFFNTHVATVIKEDEGEETALTVEIPEKTEVPKEMMVSEESTEETEATKEEMPTEESTVAEDEIPEEESDETSDEESEDFDEEEQPKKSSWKKIIFVCLVASAVALLATLTIWYFFATDDFNKRIYGPITSAFTRPASNGPSDKDALASAALPSATTMDIDSTKDSIQELQEENPEVPTAPSDAVVYDTIGTTRYLTTMARSHYGDFNFWPYIYQENQSILGHPDRIRPGTAVVIPKLSKYGVDPTKSEDVEKAKKLGVEIYARYGKKI